MSERWEDDAACRGAPIEVFFPEPVRGRNDDWRPARAICGRCPVIGACLSAALLAGDVEGFRGGRTPSELATMAGVASRLNRPHVCVRCGGSFRSPGKRSYCGDGCRYGRAMEVAG